MSIIAGFTVTILIWIVLKLLAGIWIFIKMGEAGWKSIIPIYHDYIIYKNVWSVGMFWIYFGTMILGNMMNSFGKSHESDMALMIGSLLLLINAVISIVTAYYLSKAFNHGIGFTIGLIFLQPIFIMILGFGSSQYIGNQSSAARY